MSDTLAKPVRRPIPTAERPLLGTTILAVEDSRFAAEALRQMCLHSGARIRRADCLRSARRHLSMYRPDVLIVDLGLPDGCGTDLIRDVCAEGQVPTIAVSGLDTNADAALAAGARSFFSKPLPSLGSFQEAVLALLPEPARPRGPRPVSAESPQNPDALAFRDDLEHAAGLMRGHPDAATLRYVGGFLNGVARLAADAPLQSAARRLVAGPVPEPTGSSEVRPVLTLLEQRLSAAEQI